MEEREALVFGGEFVGVVDAVVTTVAECGLVGGAENRGLVFVTDVALDLHLQICIMNYDGCFCIPIYLDSER